MQLLILPDGTTRCLYSEELDLSRLGRCRIMRASHVEPTGSGEWLADLSPVHGPVLGPFSLRSQALQAETDWLLQHRLVSPVAAIQFPQSGDVFSPSVQRSLPMHIVHSIRQFTRRAQIWSRQIVNRCRHIIQNIHQRYRRHRGN